MKKLSEIGTPFEENEPRYGEEAAKSGMFYTPAERREFAKLLVERWAWREDLGQTFEEFLEEQGI